MIAFLTLCYVGFIWLIFMKLKLLPWGRATQAIVATVGVVGIFMLIVLMGLYQPQTVEATVSQRVVPAPRRSARRCPGRPRQARSARPARRYSAP